MYGGLHLSLIMLPTDSKPKIAASTPKEMINVSVVNGQTVVRINNSSLNTIMQCLRKTELSLKRGLGPKHESPATIFGTAIHLALEVFYAGKKEERVLPKDYTKNFETLAYGGEVSGCEEFLLYRAAKAFITKAEPLSSLDATDMRSILSGVWMLSHYFKVYIDDPYTVYCDEDGPMVERRLEKVIYETPELKIIVFGTIDVVLQNTANGQLLITDHKTSSRVGKDFFNRLKPNHQYTGYTWLAQEVLGLGTNKFMVNCLQVKPKPKTARGTRPNFPRQVTTRTQEDFEEFKTAVVHNVLVYLDWLYKEDWPIGTVEACTAYGGCKFLSVCSSPKSIRENIIEAEFKKGVYC